MIRAAAIIDASEKVVWSSRHALAAFRRGDGFVFSAAKRLSSSSPEVRGAIRSALQHCFGPLQMRPDEHYESDPIVVSRESGPPYILQVLRLPAGLAHEAPLALLLLNDPDVRSPEVLKVMRNVYTLSPTECRLVQAISHGMSLTEFSESNKMSYETARSHVRRILHKTGARRQAELVGLYYRLC